MQNRNMNLRLMESAIVLTAKDGIENVTTKKLSKDLDISEATIYRHYDSKDKLLSEAFLEVDARVSDILINVVKSHLEDDKRELMPVLREAWKRTFYYLLDCPSDTLFLIRFRYSSMYTDAVREKRRAYNGAFEKAYELLGMVLDESGAYKGFLFNYIFELTLSFAEKIITGRLEDTPELEEKLWFMCCQVITTFAVNKIDD